MCIQYTVNIEKEPFMWVRHERLGWKSDPPAFPTHNPEGARGSERAGNTTDTITHTLQYASTKKPQYTAVF